MKLSAIPQYLDARIEAYARKWTWSDGITRALVTTLALVIGARLAPAMVREAVVYPASGHILTVGFYLLAASYLPGLAIGFSYKLTQAMSR